MSINIKKNAINIKNGDTYDNVDAFFAGDIEDAVGDWLEDHPEVTTTVQDGSITSNKLTTSLLGDINAAKAAINGVLVAENTSQMTQENTAYVYTGNQTGYTAGKWYYKVGNTIKQGGTYQGTVPVVDDTLTISGAAADAKVTGDEINELGNVINALLVTTSVELNFVNGNINASGSATTSTTRLRNTDFIYCPQGFSFLVPTGFKVFLRYFESDSLSSISGSSDGWITETVNINNYNGNYIRVILAKTDDSSISPEDLSNTISINTKQKTDKTLTLNEKSADAKEVGKKISYISNVLNTVVSDMPISFGNANLGYWKILNDIATKQTASSGYYYAYDPIMVTKGQMYTVIMNCNSGHPPIILANYINNQYNVVDIKTVQAQKTPENFEFNIPSGVTHILLTRYGTNTSNMSITLKAQKTDSTLTIAGVSADAKETGDEINSLKTEFQNITSYKELFNGILENGFINGSGVFTTLSNGVCYRCEIKPGAYLKATVTGNNNRLIVYGSTDNTHFTEITRDNTAKSIDFQAGDYTYCCIQIYYGSNSVSTDNFDLSIKQAIIVDNLETFKVNKVALMTKEQAQNLNPKLLIAEPKAMITNLNLPAESLSDVSTNLCFMAGKIIYENGKEPTYTGYLFCDIATNKFYYSSKPEGEYQYLFTWDPSLADGDRVSLWNATITADGDVIFLKYRYRKNPIIYPHTDYTQPFIVNFGDDKKPDGWLVNSSVVHFTDGTFVFGDYAAHKESDEANNDGRIIWRVTKPYNNPNNWTKAHIFKHVYFGHHYSDEPENEIGHIHAIMYDFYTDDLYCTTGDIDRHCRMWISEDRGETWAAVPGAVGTTEDVITSGAGQKWRMTNSVFTEDAIWWGTDAQKPNHKLWKCTRDENGHIDFSTLTEVINLETSDVPSGYSQRTYIVALMRGKNGLLILDRGEPRPDILDIKFYDFETEKLYIVATYKRATTDASSLEDSKRLGLAMQATTIYQPFDVDGIITGGGTYVRPNNTSIFNNSQTNYVGALKIKIV